MKNYKFLITMLVAFFSVYGAEGEARLDRVKRIAAPLFIEGMRECDKEAIISYLSKITDYKTETERSFDDMEDIVRRSLAVCPNLVASSPLAATFGRDDVDTPENITGLARQFAACGFADVKPEDRDSLFEAAKSLFDEPVDDFFVCNALANLQEFTDPSLRTSLIALAKKHSLPSSLRARVVGMLGDIEPSNRDDYDRILGLMPTVYQFLGKEWPQVDGMCLYRIMRAISKNITDESLQDLMDYTKDFLGADFDKSNCEWEPFGTRQQAFSAFGGLSAAIREKFTDRVRKMLGAELSSNVGTFQLLNSVEVLSRTCETLEELEELLTSIKPITARAPGKHSVVSMLGYTHDKAKRQLVLDQIKELAFDHETGIATDKELLKTVLQVFSEWPYAGHDTRKKDALIEDFKTLSKQLPAQYHSRLLQILACFPEPIERQKAIEMFKTLSWKGNDNPTFSEQMDFLQDMENAWLIIKSFTGDKQLSLETLNTAVAKAKKLSADILLEERAIIASNGFLGRETCLLRLAEKVKGDECGQLPPNKTFISDYVFSADAYADTNFPSSAAVLGANCPEVIHLLATMGVYNNQNFGNKKTFQLAEDTANFLKIREGSQVLQRTITDGINFRSIEVIHNPNLTVADMLLRESSAMCFLEAGRHANGRMDMVVSIPKQKQEVRRCNLSESKVTIEGSEIIGNGGKIAATDGTAEISGTDITNLDEAEPFEISATQALTIEHGILKGKFLLTGNTGIHLENVVFVGAVPQLCAENITFKNVRYNLDGKTHAISSLDDHYPLLLGVSRASE